MTSEELIAGLTLIAVLGIGAQWLAWRLRIPSIFLLLMIGFGAGNVTDLLRPDEIFGDVLLPAVSMAVAIILFEGGLGLRFAEIRGMGATVLNLVTAGAAVTWGLSAGAAWLLLGLDPGPALLLGAILVVTGPTVISPLLRHVRPVGKVGPILKWEGIVIDPIGAMLTVLVLEALVSGRFGRAATTLALGGVARTLVVGIAVGALTGFMLALLLERFWIPDFLQNPVAIAFVLGAFAAANSLQAESGLLAAPIIGLVLANRSRVSVKHIAEFQENIRVLLLSALFIVLGARTRFETLQDLGWQSFAFLGALVLLVRPAAVFASTLGSSLRRNERAFLAAMAPRGVVAAAVSSVVAIRLAESGRPVGERLVAEAFLIIVGTVAIYGLGALPAARLLGLTQKDPSGLLIVGAYAWTRKLAEVLQAEGQDVLLVDSNLDNVRTARMSGLKAEHADASSPEALEDVSLEGMGRLLAMTSNAELNLLATINFSEVFGRSEVFRLPPERTGVRKARSESADHRGRRLFSPDANFTDLTIRFAQGARIRATSITKQFGMDELRATYGDSLMPLFAISSTGKLTIYVVDDPPKAGPGDTVISITGPDGRSPDPAAEGDRATAD